jgi:hypothetical protein
MLEMYEPNEMRPLYVCTRKLKNTQKWNNIGCGHSCGNGFQILHEKDTLWNCNLS